MTYKYELVILNKQIHFSAFHSVCYSQFNNLNSELKFNKPGKQSKTIPESSVPWIIIEMTLKCLCHSCVVNCCSLCLYCQWCVSLCRNMLSEKRHYINTLVNNQTTIKRNCPTFNKYFCQYMTYQTFAGQQPDFRLNVFVFV